MRSTAGHGRAFKQFMRACHLEGKATATRPSAQGVAVLSRVAEALGPYPHAPLTLGAKQRKQGTRLLKARCPACDCVVRITRQWAGANGETAPICGFCSIDGRPETFTRMVLGALAPTED